MTFLIFSILTNTAIYILFKWFDRLGIKIFEAIVTNYIVAFTIGFFVIENKSETVEVALQWPVWSVVGLSLGVLFITIFYMMALTAQRVGVSVATIASKMSLALAVILFAIVDSKEQLNMTKGIAILLAMGGVVFSSIKEDGESIRWKDLIWPLTILVGGTIIDFSIAHFSSFPNNNDEMALFGCMPFLTAAITGLTVLLFHAIKKEYKPNLKNIGAGILLGTVNYGSIYFLIKTYDLEIWPKSIVLPLNNLSVVIVGAVAAVLLFKEKLSTVNYLGIVLSVAALAILLQS